MRLKKFFISTFCVLLLCALFIFSGCSTIEEKYNETGTVKLVIGDDGTWYEAGYDKAGIRQYVLGYYMSQDLIRNRLVSSEALNYSNLTHPEEFDGVPFNEDHYGAMLWCSFDQEGKPDKYVEFDTSNMSLFRYDYCMLDHSLDGHNYSGELEDEITVDHDENGQVTHIAYIFHREYDGEYWDSYMDDYLEYDLDGNMIHSYRTRHSPYVDPDDEFVEEDWFDYEQEEELHMQAKARESSDRYNGEDTVVRLFDENGRILVNAQLEFSYISSLWSYEYDSNGNLISAKEYSPEYLDEGENIGDYILKIQNSERIPFGNFIIERDPQGFALRLTYDGEDIFNPLYSVGLNVGDTAELPGYGTIEVLSADCGEKAVFPDGKHTVSGGSAYQYYLNLKFTNHSGHTINVDDIGSSTSPESVLFLSEDITGPTAYGVGGSYYFQGEEKVRNNKSLDFMLDFSVDYPLYEEYYSISDINVRFILFNKFTCVLHPRSIFLLD